MSCSREDASSLVIPDEFAMTELLATAIYRARVCQVPAHVLAQTIMAAIQTEVTRAKGELLECMRTASGVGP